MDMARQGAGRSGRGGGREARRAARAESASEDTSVYRNLRNPYKPIEVFSEDQIEAIHDTSLTMLEEIGLKVLWPEARAIYKAGGAEVDEGEQRVRFDRSMILEAVAQAPSLVKIHARNPAHDIVFGEDRVVFITVGGPPNYSDLDGGRRPGNLQALRDFIRMAQSFDVIHALGAPVEPIDVPLNVRHLEIANCYLSESDKTAFVYSRGPEALGDSVEMMRIAPRRQPGPARGRGRLLHRGQHELAAATRRAHVPGHHRHGALGPGHGGDALYARRGHGADHHPRRPGAAERRSPGRHRPGATGPPRRQGGLRRLYIERRHEVGRTGLRHAGVHPGRPGQRPVWPGATACHTAPPT